MLISYSSFLLIRAQFATLESLKPQQPPQLTQQGLKQAGQQKFGHNRYNHTFRKPWVHNDTLKKSHWRPALEVVWAPIHIRLTDEEKRIKHWFFHNYCKIFKVGAYLTPEPGFQATSLSQSSMPTCRHLWGRDGGLFGKDQVFFPFSGKCWYSYQQFKSEKDSYIILT